MLEYFVVFLGGILGYGPESARGDLETVTFSAAFAANAMDRNAF